jgi:hypothetical protein
MKATEGTEVTEREKKEVEKMKKNYKLQNTNYKLQCSKLQTKK